MSCWASNGVASTIYLLMFSGIIDKVGRIAAIGSNAAGKTLRIDADGDYWQGVPLGASIAIDGVCLTVTDITGTTASFDVVAETLRCSTLGALSIGGSVNLQKSMCVGDRIDGHFVQGHVDATGIIDEIVPGDLSAMWWFKTSADAMQMMVPKGSITIDGISLTVAAREAERFAVALIPTTLRETTIGNKQVGQSVNLETDVLVRTIAHFLHNGKPDAQVGGITHSFLQTNGFA